MRPLRLWHRVGSPTWKRSGTLIFSAVMGVLLIGGTAMAANLGLLTSTAPGDRGHRLEVPRPPLSVSLPTTEPAPPIVDSTSVPQEVEESDADADVNVDDDDAGNSPAAEGSSTEKPDDESDDTTEPTSDRDDDAEIEDDIDPDDDDDDDDARSNGESGKKDRDRVEPDEGSGIADRSKVNSDGSLDDD